MSDPSYDRAPAFMPTSDFDPGHQLPTRAAISPLAATEQPTYTATQDATRIQQLDAGVMQTLNLQAKLAIGAPNDQYEQEADQVAAQVVERINTPQTQQKSIQRESMPEDEELQMQPLASIQRESMPEEEELQMQPLVQRREEGEGMASASLETSLNTARGQGEPLSAGVRGSMEQAFGADFSGVRVHTDSQSDQLNHSLQARAFTTGQDIFFKQGEFQPEQPGGQELLAHELTHVVQQNGSTVQPKQR